LPCNTLFTLLFDDAGTLPVAGGTSQYAAGSVVYPPAVPLVPAGVLGMPDLTYSPVPPDARSSGPVPSAPIPLSSLHVNLSSPSQGPPLYQPSPLPPNTVPGSDVMSGVGGPPPPPPTAGFVPSHGVVSATPGKVSSLFVVCTVAVDYRLSQLFCLCSTSEVLAVGLHLSSCVSVTSQRSVQTAAQIRLIFAYRLPLDYPTLCLKVILPSVL